MDNKNTIHRLADQAGVSIDKMGYGEGNIENLATLIINECIGVIKAGAQDAQDNLTFLGDDVPSRLHQTNILAHFGMQHK